MPPVSPKATRVAAPIPAIAGIGLRYPHHAHVLDHRPATGWFEVHPENYLGAGVVVDDLLRIRRDHPVSLHATGLSLGSACGIDERHLEDLAGLCARVEPGLVSDHLSWSAIPGRFLHDLLPLPYGEEALTAVAENVDRVQTRLGRPMLIENPSAYLAFSGATFTEGQLLGALVARTGCGILLDLNNVVVSARNRGVAPSAWLEDVLGHVPHGSIGEIHVAGHSVQRIGGGASLRVDDHGSPVGDEVWSLLSATVAAIGRRPVLVEWDTAIPAFAVLEAQAMIAQRALDAVEVAHAVAC